jgi:ribosomal protein S18 acetylase RimI-like enzyme
MTSPHPLEILDLRHFNARQLRPLLEVEAQLWQRRLHWDYESSTELLLQYLDSRILPGFVALDLGRICGYCFCVYEGTKAVVGDVFAEPSPNATAITQTLARHLFAVLDASPEVQRIEAQLLLFEPSQLGAAFAPAAFDVYPRLFLERALAAETGSAGTPALPPAIELAAWSPVFYQPAAELIQAAYIGHIDSQINDQYRTLAGSLRFLHNVIRFPGCGVFDPEVSFVLRQRATGALVGIVLCSRVAPTVAHVTQLCIAPSFRGAHLGRSLLRVSLAQLAARGYDALTLTVTEANKAALHLYQDEGFHTRQRFDALVLEKSAPPRRPTLLSRITSTR